MLNTLPKNAGAEGNLIRTSDTMDEKIPQQCALETEILRMRQRDMATQHQVTLYIRKRFAPHSPLVKPKVSMPSQKSEPLTNIVKHQLAAQILLSANLRCVDATAIPCTEECSDRFSETTYSSIDEYHHARWASSPELGSGRSTPETEKSSACSSCEAESRKVAELLRLLMGKDCDIQWLSCQCEQVDTQMYKMQEKHQELEAKYATQLEQCHNDWANVVEAKAYCEAVDEEYAELDAKFETLQK